jgi:transposase
MIPGNIRIYVATEAADMRRGFAGLAAAAREALGQDVRSGALVVFFNRRRDRLKLLWCDSSGTCLFYKQLSRGVFRIPEPLYDTDRSVQIEARELARILEGVALPARCVQLRQAA